MTGGGRHEITFSRWSCAPTESRGGEDTLCPKLDTQRQPIVDANNNFERIVMEDASEWLERASKLYLIQKIARLPIVLGSLESRPCRLTEALRALATNFQPGDNDRKTTFLLRFFFLTNRTSKKHAMCFREVGMFTGCGQRPGKSGDIWDVLTKVGASP
jgi:hypothetical protein